MKTARKLLAVLFILSLLAGLGIAASAADAPKYTVRIFAGNEGTIGGSSVLTFTVEAGKTFSFNAGDSVTVTDDRYYPKGIHVAGQDDLYSGDVTFTVNEDMDFTIVYGMKSQAVQYTVNYVSTDGTKLHDSKTLYGNIDDYPALAGVYVEGYVPQGYKETKKLVADPSQNIFTFLYTPIPVIEVTPTPSPTPNGGGTYYTIPTTTPTASAPAQAGTGTGTTQSNTTTQNSTTTQSGTTAQSGTTNQSGSTAQSGSTTKSDTTGSTEATTPTDTKESGDTEKSAATQAASADNGAETTTQQTSKTARGAIIAGASAIVAAAAALWYGLTHKKKNG